MAREKTQFIGDLCGKVIEGLARGRTSFLYEELVDSVLKDMYSRRSSRQTMSKSDTKKHYMNRRSHMLWNVVVRLNGGDERDERKHCACRVAEDHWLDHSPDQSSEIRSPSNAELAARINEGEPIEIFSYQADLSRPRSGHVSVGIYVALKERDPIYVACEDPLYKSGKGGERKGKKRLELNGWDDVQLELYRNKRQTELAELESMKKVKK